MQVERSGEEVRLVLGAEDVKLLKRALERASFMDTPAAEQSAIAGFCEQMLEALGKDE